LAERRSPKPQVGGSIPSWPAKNCKIMKNSINSTISFKDVILWAGIATVTVVAFLCTYYFDLSLPVKAIIWIVWFILAIFLACFTTIGRQAVAFTNEAKIELQKVVWPTRQETIQTTSIVMIMVAVTGFVLWAIDSGMMWVIAKITHLG
jgi:preprotein translocase subunit SecE